MSSSKRSTETSVSLLSTELKMKLIKWAVIIITILVGLCVATYKWRSYAESPAHFDAKDSTGLVDAITFRYFPESGFFHKMGDLGGFLAHAWSSGWVGNGLVVVMAVTIMYGAFEIARNVRSRS